MSQSTSNDLNTQSNPRDYVLRGTLVGAAAGFALGLVFGTYARVPMSKMIAMSTFNGAFAAFTYTGLTVALDKKAGLSGSSYKNNLLSGAITGTSIYGFVCASSGAIDNVKTALKVTARGATGGAVLGSLAWYLFSREMSVNNPLLDSSAPVATTDSWSPVRRSTEADLLAQASDYANRERRAAQQTEYLQHNQSR